MLRVSTIHASSASASAKYYTRYLTGAPGEVPGVWAGRQAEAFKLSGTVGTEELERLLSGHHPRSGVQLGHPLVDRLLATGRVIQAVGGFDATFSAPKSVSVCWALSGDQRFLEAHDIAVAAALEHLERCGSTTRTRFNGGRLHPDTNGLTVAVFRQTTSRAGDPQLHTHAVISAKVRTADGRWLALDARYLKIHQRMLGGLYQSVLRNELTHRLGVEWGPIVNGQAEIAGCPGELLTVFSKRAAEIDEAMKVKVGEFRQRNGRAPTRFERAALEREASADTRGRKSGLGVADLATRWQSGAADAGWTVERLVGEIQLAAVVRSPADSLTVAEVVEAVSAQHSSWGRPDVIRAICDVRRPVSHMSGHRWAATVERAADRVLQYCVDLDPPGVTLRRDSDGRSLWIEPTAPRYASDAVLTQEEHILSWAIEAQAESPAPSKTVSRYGLDVLQAEAAAAVAGDDRLVLVVGPAGAGKTRMLAAAVNDLHTHGRAVFGAAPTAKAARVLERDTGVHAVTVAKLLHEWQRSDRAPLPEFQLGRGSTLVIDEAGMISTPALHQLVTLAEAQRWRLVLVGDHRQLQAVGRGGLFAELCGNGRVDELQRLHRFTHRWEAAASLQLRSGDPRCLDAYESHNRIIPGSVDEHLAHIAETWIERHRHGDTVALVASTNDHVDVINRAVQTARLAAGHLDPSVVVAIAGGEHVHVGEVVATRRNDRTVVSSTREPVRNRELWTVSEIGADGALTVARIRGHSTVTLPSDYAREHVRLGYAATEHGYQSDTVDHAIALVSTATTRRGLYVAMTRGRDENLLCVVTDSNDVAEARDVLDGILALDRADIPAVTQRRTLGHQVHGHEPAHAPRCSIPDWFEPLLARARANLAATKARHDAHAAERERLHQAVVAAERRLRAVDAATAVDRDALADAELRINRARGDLSAARYQLDSARRRDRRHARGDLDIAERLVERAAEYLERTRQRTARSISDFDHARLQRNAASEDLHRHEMTVRGDQRRDPHDAAQRRVHALETWRSWADGRPVAIERLREVATTLAAERDRNQAHSRLLGDAIDHWASNNGIDLNTRQRVERDRGRVGPELSL